MTAAGGAEGAGAVTEDGACTSGLITLARNVRQQVRLHIQWGLGALQSVLNVDGV